MSLKEEFQRIYDETGELSPSIVVEITRAKDHPLHERYYSQEDAELAHERRLDMARDDIQRCRIKYREATKNNDGTIRAFHAVPNEGRMVYRPAMEVAADPLLAELVLSEAKREWESLRRRYGHLKEFIKMVQGDIVGAAAD